MPISTPAGASTGAVSLPPEQRRSPRRMLLPAFRHAPPWLCGFALALPLAAAYLLVSPPSGDLAAAAYRSDLFARAGFAVWDNGWYAGHNLPAYSLLAPALGAWLGVRQLLALSAIAAAVLFGLLASQALPRRPAQAAALVFAFGFCAELPSGRVPYDLGVAIGMGALLAMSWAAAHRGGRALALAGLAVALSIATCAASPVAGAFLALAGLAVALAALAIALPGLGGIHSAGRETRAWAQAPLGLAVCAAALLPILVLAAAFPEGGFEPFVAGAFWPELVAAVAFAALLPRGNFGPRVTRALRVGAYLYALALALSFLVKTPVGGNAVRLGALLGAPLLVGALWGQGQLSIGGRRVDARLVLIALAPLLLYWQLASAIDDQLALAGDPTVQSSFYAPLRTELLRLAADRPIRVEVPLTGAHWESAYLPSGPISIARGWERQLDTRYGSIFYRRGLTAASYRRWLQSNAVAYVALPKARLDSAGEQEARLVRAGLPYLREIWRTPRWRLFAVLDPTPLAQPPARMIFVGVDSFALSVPRPGTYAVRLHWTPYWALRGGAGCVLQAPGGFTAVQAHSAGTIGVGIEPSLSRAFSEGPRCER